MICLKKSVIFIRRCGGVGGSKMDCQAGEFFSSPLLTFISSLVSAQLCIHYNSTHTASAHPAPFHRTNFHSGAAIILPGLFRSAVTRGSVLRNSYARGICRNRVLPPFPVLFGYSAKTCFVCRFRMVKSCVSNVYCAKKVKCVPVTMRDTLVRVADTQYAHRQYTRFPGVR